MTIDDEHGSEPECEGPDEADLKGPHDVLIRRAKDQEECTRRGCHPLLNFASKHQAPEQMRYCDVCYQQHPDVRLVTAQAKDAEQRSIYENWYCRPMLVVGNEETDWTASEPAGEEVPLIEPEPLLARHEEQQRERHDERSKVC